MINGDKTQILNLTEKVKGVSNGTTIEHLTEKLFNDNIVLKLFIMDHE